MEYAKAYPPSTTRNDNYRDRDQNTQSNVVPQNQGQNCYHQDNRNVPVTGHAMHPEPDVHIQVNDDYLPPYAIQLADNAERRDGHCHNCKESGHFCRECQQPLREEFKHLMDHTHQHQEELNKNGGPRAKGG